MIDLNRKICGGIQYVIRDIGLVLLGVTVEDETYRFTSADVDSKRVRAVLRVVLKEILG